MNGNGAFGVDFFRDLRKPCVVAFDVGSLQYPDRVAIVAEVMGKTFQVFLGKLNGRGGQLKIHFESYADIVEELGDVVLLREAVGCERVQRHARPIVGMLEIGR